MKLFPVLGLVSLGACAALYLGCSSSTVNGSSSGGGTSDAATDAKVDTGKVDGGGGGDGGAPACYDTSNAGVFPTTKATANQGKCTAVQIKGFFDACLGNAATEADCKAFDENVANTDCNKCMFGPVNGDDVTKFSDPPMIETDTSVFINTGLCSGLAAGDAACAKKLSDEGTCLISSCAACEDADADACDAFAAGDACKQFLAGATCEATVKAKQAAVDAQCDAADFDTLYTKVVTYICGAP
jgi:hypothetical protein